MHFEIMSLTCRCMCLRLGYGGSASPVLWRTNSNEDFNCKNLCRNLPRTNTWKPTQLDETTVFGPKSADIMHDPIWACTLAMTNPRTSLAFYVIPFCHRGHLCGQNLVSISAPRTSFLRGQCGILSKSADNRGQFADTHFAAFGRAAIVAWRLWLASTAEHSGSWGNTVKVFMYYSI